jgi:hypothetical protein
LLWTGAVRGFGRITPVVSDTGVTSMAAGGAMIPSLVEYGVVLGSLVSIESDGQCFGTWGCNVL